MPNDYRTMTERDPDAPAPKSRAVDSPGFWWRQEKDDAHGAVAAAVKSLRSDQAYRTEANLRHMRLYGNYDAVGFGLRDAQRSLAGPNVNRMAFNMVATCSDTLAARIAKNRPRPFFLTEGGSWNLQQRAKKLDKFCQGKFYEMRLHELGRQVFLDACVLGTGALKFYSAEGRVCAERTMVEELLVDDADGYYGTPRQMFQRKAVPREIAFEQWGYDAKGKRDEQRWQAITAARRPDGVRSARQDYSDMIEVFEAWHLPSSQRAKDGRHVIALDTTTLCDDGWVNPWFPFAFIKLFPRQVGFFGQGVAERLTGLQLELNRLIKSISAQLQRKGRGRVFLPVGSNVADSHITNGIADIIHYTGQQPPVVDASNAVAPEEFQQLERLRQACFEEVGVSQLNATGTKPAGLNSGAALREYNDFGAERFALVGQAYEQLFVDAGAVIIGMTKQLYEEADEGEGAWFEARVPGKKFLETIKWKDVSLEDDQFVMKAYPVSSLPQTPQGKMEAVQEMLLNGWLPDKAEAMRLLDMPDLENSHNLTTAAIDDVDQAIDDILDGTMTRANWRPPDELQNLGAIITRGTAAYLYARREGCPPEQLAMLHDYMDQAADLLAKAKQEERAQAAAAAPSPMVPAGMPAPMGAPGLPAMPGQPPTPLVGPMGPGGLIQ